MTSSETLTASTIDNQKWFTTTQSDVDRHIKRVNEEIVKQYALYKSCDSVTTFIRVRIDESVPLLGVREHFSKQGIMVKSSFGFDRPTCKCDNDNGSHWESCKKVGYLLYIVTFNV